MIAIVNGRVIADEGIVDGKILLIENGRISGLSDNVPDGVEILDACGNYVSPGFIDIHIHGGGGCDTMDGTAESLNHISKLIAKHGVTSFLPTTMTYEVQDIIKAVKAVKDTMHNGTEGANILGVHLEGPFINEKNKGAQDAKFVQKPDINLMAQLVQDDFSVVRNITLAPEIERADELIRFLVGHGITVSLGHTNGTYDEAMSGIGHGVSHSTHLYNAMRGFSHREPGVVGAIFDSRITSELIADGVHLHFAAIRTALAVKGYENCALITDAMSACGMKDGEYILGGQKVYVKDGAARLHDGTLAGSTLTLDTAVKNIIKNTSLNIFEAVYMATAVPARIIKADNAKGHIRQGYDADIVIFDQDINIKTTIVGGRIV